MLTEKMGHDKPLLLVDGSSYLFRAYHALPDLRTSKGEPTGAVRGVISMLRKLRLDYPGSHVVVVFDAKGKTFRNDLYADYKAHRPPMPDDLRVQIAYVHDIVRALNLPLLIIEGVEADDVIGTLAAQASTKKIETVISTSDKDMAQLVTPHVSLVNTMSDTHMDRQGVIDKFGVPPELIIDYLALMGDASDNIPGVPKVGPKTAAKWLNEYGSLDGVVENAENIKGKVGESLRNSLDLLPLSKVLTTIVCDVELGVNLDELEPVVPDNPSLHALYTRLEFKTWLKELDGSKETSVQQNAEDVVDSGVVAGEPDAAGVRGNYQTILELKDLTKLLKRIKKNGLCAFDTETTSLNYMQAQLVGVSLAVCAGEAAYIPLAHDYSGAPTQIPFKDALDALKSILEDPKITKVAQNLKYDQSVMARYGIQILGPIHDTMLQSYVLNSVATRHNMDALARHYLDVKTIPFEDVCGKGAKQITFNEVHLDQAAEYAAEDADITLQLHQHLWPLLKASQSADVGLRSIYSDIESPLIPVLSKVERTGTLVDGDLLLRQSEELAGKMEELTQQAWEEAGSKFNLASPKQLQDIFYNQLNLPVLKKTPKGQPSTAEPVLIELANEFELPRIILEYRGMAKLKSTYTDKLPLQIDPQTGRVHTSYHQAVAATGRLSSSDPNLQNIPIRTPEGRKVRQAFIAPEGRCLLAADYSQIELRIMAHLSGDAGLTAAFEQNVDVHRLTAAEVFGESIDTVSDDQRRSAKAINFGLIYGMSAFGLSRQLKVSRKTAVDYIDMYFARYPGVKTYMDDIREQAQSNGYVETVFGRRLYLPEINARNGQRRQAAERTAINAPMQGTAADIIKRAMISVDKWLTTSKIDACMVMQVHDELVFEVAEDAVEDLSVGVSKYMQNAAQLNVPLIVDIGTGENWDVAH